MGASWEYLGGLLGFSSVMQPLVEVVGLIGVLVGGYVAAANFVDHFWRGFGHILGLKRIPKRVRNWSQNDSKSKGKPKHDIHICF